MGARRPFAFLEEIGYRFIDMAPVSHYLGGGRPRYQASLRLANGAARARRNRN